ncbi:MAG: hypothetical protein IPM21_05090 [Acidobacteria bacterium]|nr:hypothetical protein [Acidobacteriota bacterium]
MIWFRAIAVWLLMMAVETVHGILRVVLLAPQIGDLRARQIAIFTGSAIILGIAYLFIGWVGAQSKLKLLAIGFVWMLLTLGFEAVIGIYAFGFGWERILAEYDPRTGSLMLFGLFVLLFAPLVAFGLRRGQ